MSTLTKTTLFCIAAIALVYGILYVRKYIKTHAKENENPTNPSTPTFATKASAAFTDLIKYDIKFS